MKNKKYLGLFGLGCGLLLLTGCGGNAHALKCSQERDGDKVSVTVNYNSDETEIESVEMEMVMDSAHAEEEVSKDDLEQARDLLEQSYCEGSEKLDKCSVKIDGTKVVVNLKGSAKATAEVDEKTSLKDLKPMLEEAGYKCD